MPVIATLPPLKSPPTNAFGLFQYLATRLPGYDVSEYLRELNSAYIHVWEEITKLKNQYFTNIVTVNVVTAQTAYDLMFNADGGLSAAVSPRLYQVTRIRVQPPAGGLFQTTIALQPNNPDFVATAANVQTSPTQSGPYYWHLSGRNQLVWALPLAIGTKIEVSYTFWPVALTILANGTVSSSGNTVTGTSTNFTNMVQPDFQTNLPSVQGQEEIQAEFVCNGTVPLGGQIYRVTKITSDTALLTNVAISPTLVAGAAYVLATLPEIPREHIRVIAAIAMQKMYSVAEDDARAAEWTAISQSNVQMMKDALIERQGQNAPQKLRFPYGIGRRNRAFLR
jgi:hypothetical protein